MKFFLIAAKGKQKGMLIPIKVDLFLMGSEKICQLRSQMPGIAGQHCALVSREKKVFVRDLDSGQPTLVNGEVITPGIEWPLHDGDRVSVGPLEFLIQFHEKQLSQRDMEEWALRCLDKAGEGKSVDGAEEEEGGEGTRAARPTNAAAAAAAILDRLQSQRGVVKGRLRISNEEGVTVVRINDVYLVEESEIAMVKKELQDNLNRPNLRVLLDFKNVSRMSSAAVEMILDLHTWLRPWGSSLALCRIRGELREVVHSLHLRQNIPHFGDKKVAVGARW